MLLTPSFSNQNKKGRIEYVLFSKNVIKTTPAPEWFLGYF